MKLMKGKIFFLSNEQKAFQKSLSIALDQAASKDGFATSSTLFMTDRGASNKTFATTYSKLTTLIVALVTIGVTRFGEILPYCQNSKKSVLNS